jgi:mono/diheme cytochrome c family protein
VRTRKAKGGMGVSPMHLRLEPLRDAHGRDAHATWKRPHTLAALTLLATVVLLAGCRKEDMADQARQDPFDESRFFADGQSARPLVDGTVARGHPPVRDVLTAVSSGVVGETEATSFPEGVQINAQALESGRQQYDIFCAVCHGRLGDGNGMIVQRGFPRPPSFYTARLRSAPVGHFYNVISNGYGAMYSYGDRIKVADRWHVSAYIRALQASAPNRIDPDIARAATQPSPR